MVKPLAVGNYDSFVYMLVDYLRLLDASVTMVRDDVVDLASISSYGGVLASSGPRTPAKAGAAVAVVEQCTQIKTPMLGVCLGHWVLAEAFGGVVLHVPALMYEKASVIRHNDRGLFEGLPSPLTVGRYHSLAAESGTVRELVITAWTNDGIVMGVEHAEPPLWGMQFHPESVLAQGGHWVLTNWLVVCDQPEALEAVCGRAPLIWSDKQVSQGH